MTGSASRSDEGSANDGLWVSGVGRCPGEHEYDRRTIEVYFNRAPTDDELRAFHDSIRNRPRSESAPLQPVVPTLSPRDERDFAADEAFHYLLQDEGEAYEGSETADAEPIRDAVHNILCEHIDDLDLRGRLQKPISDLFDKAARSMGAPDYALMFAEELFALINYRRTHSLSRDVWHEADITDKAGGVCIEFLNERGVIEHHPERPTWWRFIDPEKRAKPPEVVIDRALSGAQQHRNEGG